LRIDGGSEKVVVIAHPREIGGEDWLLQAIESRD